MTKKLILNLVRNKFKEEGIYVFAPFDLQKFFNVSANTASLFLTRNVKNNNLLKIRCGLYAFQGDYLSEFLLANKVYSPSYVSFEYALAFYSIIPEMVYTVTCASTKTTREFDVNNIIYSYQHIKKKAFIGYAKKDFNGQVALVAEPEKALADYLYFVCLGRKWLNDRLDLSNVNKEKVIHYAKLFKNNKIMNLIDEVYDNFRRNQENIH